MHCHVHQSFYVTNNTSKEMYSTSTWYAVQFIHDGENLWCSILAVHLFITVFQFWFAVFTQFVRVCMGLHFIYQCTNPVYRITFSCILPLSILLHACVIFCHFMNNPYTSAHVLTIKFNVICDREIRRWQRSENIFFASLKACLKNRWCTT